MPRTGASEEAATLTKRSQIPRRKIKRRKALTILSYEDAALDPAVGALQSNDLWNVDMSKYERKKGKKGNKKKKKGEDPKPDDDDDEDKDGGGDDDDDDDDQGSK